MEQWISDSFYSNFPSLNDEKNKEREQINRLRRLEYQDYVKKISNDNIISKHNESHNFVPATSRSDNTEMEIIVNNPNYEPPKHTDTRPGSTRHKLLQDLRHTELSKMMFDDAIQNRNQENIENENRKKKDYQRELMLQIEEKQKQLQILKLSEKTAEEAMAKKLQQQLKTERIRYELEQNKIIHNRLLEKLKNDLEDSVQSTSSISTEEKSHEISKDQSSQNEVYKFFKNSGTCRKSNHQLSFAGNEAQNAQLNNLPKKECSHMDQRSCPYCNMKFLFCKNCNNDFFKNENENCRLFCKNCDSQYFMCLVCDKDNECCNFCQRKRNICVQCILNYCVNCGNAMNGPKNLEDISASNNHIDEIENGHQSFTILNENDADNEDIENINCGKYIENNRNHFSTNIDRKSLFHPDYNIEDSKCDNEIKIFEDVDNFDTLRNKTNEKLSKYLKNYGDLTKKKIVKDKIEKPYLRLSDTNSINNNFQPQQNSIAMRSNWVFDDISNRPELPKETNKKYPTTNPLVITQLGAIRRQLQLDRLKNK